MGLWLFYAFAKCRHVWRRPLCHTGCAKLFNTQIVSHNMKTPIQCSSRASFLRFPQYRMPFQGWCCLWFYIKGYMGVTRFTTRTHTSKTNPIIFTDYIRQLFGLSTLSISSSACKHLCWLREKSSFLCIIIIWLKGSKNKGQAKLVVLLYVCSSVWWGI